MLRKCCSTVGSLGLKNVKASPTPFSWQQLFPLHSYSSIDRSANLVGHYIRPAYFGNNRSVANAEFLSLLLGYFIQLKPKRGPNDILMVNGDWAHRLAGWPGAIDWSRSRSLVQYGTYIWACLFVCMFVCRLLAQISTLLLCRRRVYLRVCQLWEPNGHLWSAKMNRDLDRTGLDWTWTYIPKCP